MTNSALARSVAIASAPAPALSGEPNVDAGDVYGARKIGLRDLARPSAVLDALMGVIERCPELWHVVDISRWRALRIRKPRCERGVLRPRVANGTRIGIYRARSGLVGIAERGRPRADRKHRRCGETAGAGPSRPRLVTLIMSSSTATVIAKEIVRSNGRDLRKLLCACDSTQYWPPLSQVKSSELR
jgi:hypothetical protein